MYGLIRKLRTAGTTIKKQTGQESGKRSGPCPVCFFNLFLYFAFFAASAQVSDVFYGSIVVDAGDFAVISGICFVNDFSASHINTYMADGTSAVFIKNKVSGLQLAAADGTAA